MEILSTGEKIKRSRVYKGITLKDLCGDKISISKMSCIENGKVKADEDIIKYISDKIGIDFEYLLQDVYEQIVSNLAELKKYENRNSEFENNIKHNLEYAIDYEYYELGFELIHLLFSYYLEENMYEKIQLIISQYYDLYQRTNNKENTIIYFRDMAKYLFKNNEYTEAIAYYSRLRELLNVEDNIDDKALYSYLAYNEGVCYLRIRKEETAYELFSEAVKYSDNINDKYVMGNIFKYYAIACIRLNKDQAIEYINKAYELQKDNEVELAISKCEYGEAYFDSGNYCKAVEEILQGVSIYPAYNRVKYVEFLNNNIEILYKHKKYNEAYEITDKALDLAIATDDVRLIEHVYYYKGSILKKQKRYLEAEMYMNLALDLLMKFGRKDERYNRYLEMGNMYYNLGEIKESAKYLALAMNIKKDI